MGEGLAADEVRGLRRGRMTGAEQEGEGMLVGEEGKMKKEEQRKENSAMRTNNRCQRCK